MNKQEAIEAMLEGKKLTHRYFTNEEWISMKDEDTMIDENGYTWHPDIFWKDRESGDMWDTGWSLYKQN